MFRDKKLIRNLCEKHRIANIPYVSDVFVYNNNNKLYNTSKKKRGMGKKLWKI